MIVKLWIIYVVLFLLVTTIVETAMSNVIPMDDVWNHVISFNTKLFQVTGINNNQ